MIEWRGRAAPLQGHDPADQPAGAVRRASARRSALNRHGADGAARPPVVGREGRRVGRHDRPHLAAAQRWRTTVRARRWWSCGIESVWAAQPEDISLLHMLFYIHSAGSLEHAVRHRAAAPRTAASWAARSGCRSRWRTGLAATWCSLAAPVRRIDHGAGGRHAGRRRGHRARAAGDRGDRARPGGPHRLRPAAARLPRPAHPAHAAGHRGQVHGRLRRAVLARRRAQRRRPPATWARSSSPSTTRRPTGRPACCWASSRAATRAQVGRLAPDERRASWWWTASARLFGERAARARALHRAPVGRGGVLARLLRLPHAHRRLDRLRRGAARADRPAALGGHGDRPGVVGLHGRRGALRRVGGAGGAAAL